MRLLDAETHKFHEFPPNVIPPYAILSHTWGDDEVQYEDLNLGDVSIRRLNRSYKRMAGWKKIRFTCEEALKDGLKYVWVDTCCIDKRSSAELSEAINSMFAWYQQAYACYVYLADIDWPIKQKSFQSARWFTRGWTLQELIAPQTVEFFSSNWEFIGNKGDMSEEIAEITGIEAEVLEGTKPLEAVCIARRMSWASARQTTRPEDIAYCLLGIFDINMPTIYGEGHKAFLRLQNEILKMSDDHSIFAWYAAFAPPSEPYGLLAATPAAFRDSAEVTSFRDWTGTSPYTTSNLGLSITLPIAAIGPGTYRAALNCSWSNLLRRRAGIFLKQIPGAANQFQRIRCAEKDVVGSIDLYSKMQIYVRQDQVLPSSIDVLQPSQCNISVRGLGHHGSGFYRLHSYFHTGDASLSKDWYREMIRQNAVSSSTDLDATFNLPGEHERLSLVLCIEKSPGENQAVPVETPEQRKEPAPDTLNVTEMKEVSATEEHKMPQQDSAVSPLDSQFPSDVVTRPYKGEEDSENSSVGGKFLILIGTACNSYCPTIVPRASASHVQRLEELLAAGRNNDAAGGLSPHGQEASEALAEQKAKCVDLFEDLSSVFRPKTEPKGEERHLLSAFNVGNIIARQEKRLVGGSLLHFELQIEIEEPYELDGQAISPDAVVGQPIESQSIASKVVAQSTSAQPVDYWITGPPPLSPLPSQRQSFVEGQDDEAFVSPTHIPSAGLHSEIFELE